MGVNPATAAPKGVSPQSLAVGSIAKEYKNKLAVAGMKAMNSTKRINHGLPSALLIYPSNDKDRRAKRARNWNKESGYTARVKSARSGGQRP